jgi:molybdate transport system permease protein
MDYYPLWNSLRIAGISTLIILIIGVAAANMVTHLPRWVKGIIDCIFTLPLVLPPTVIGYLLLRALGPKRLIGKAFLSVFGIKLTMNWWSAIFATSVIIFPLMYRTARSAFEAFDKNLDWAGKSLGLSRSYIFFRVKLPCCKQGIIAGCVLSFARALGEYGATSMIAGYIPGKTATISTTVYQLWRTGKDELVTKWVLINIAISAFVLIAINMFEDRNKRTQYSRA